MFGCPGQGRSKHAAQPCTAAEGFTCRARDVSVSAASTAHELRENFASAADITYKQHKSALEHQCQNKRTRTTKHADQAPLQNFVANLWRDESLLVSKAFRGGRSAKQAAEHIQQCMSTACQKAGAQQQQQQPQDHQPLGQLLQQRPLEQMAPTASHVMPQQRLDLLQECLMLQDSPQNRSSSSCWWCCS
jgi:hypothetical protein